MGDGQKVLCCVCTIWCFGKKNDDLKGVFGMYVVLFLIDLL